MHPPSSPRFPSRLLPLLSSLSLEYVPYRDLVSLLFENWFEEESCFGSTWHCYRSCGRHKRFPSEWCSGPPLPSLFHSLLVNHHVGGGDGGGDDGEYDDFSKSLLLELYLVWFLIHFLRRGEGQRRSNGARGGPRRARGRGEY